MDDTNRTSGACDTGLVYFDQLSALSAVSLTAVILGTIVLLTGVWLVSAHGAGGAEKREDDEMERMRGYGSTEHSLHPESAAYSARSDDVESGLIMSEDRSVDDLQTTTSPTSMDNATETTALLAANAGGIAGPHLPPPPAGPTSPPRASPQGTSPSNAARTPPASPPPNPCSRAGPSTSRPRTASASGTGVRRGRSRSASLLGGLGLVVDPSLTHEYRAADHHARSLSASHAQDSHALSSEQQEVRLSIDCNGLGPVGGSPADAGPHTAPPLLRTSSDDAAVVADGHAGVPWSPLGTSRSLARGLYANFLSRGLSIGLSPSSPGFYLPGADAAEQLHEATAHARRSGIAWGGRPRRTASEGDARSLDPRENGLEGVRGPHTRLDALVEESGSAFERVAASAGTSGPHAVRQAERSDSAGLSQTSRARQPVDEVIDEEALSSSTSPEASTSAWQNLARAASQSLDIGALTQRLSRLRRGLSGNAHEPS